MRLIPCLLLLAELMRIKAEGDYAAIKVLVDRYGVHFDPKFRDQIVARYKALDIPTNLAGINSKLSARTGKNGELLGVEFSYPHDAAEQYLTYGSMYDTGLSPSSKQARASAPRCSSNSWPALA